MTTQRTRDYELMMILGPEANEQEVDATLERVEGLIADGGGTVSFRDNWGVRRLAYPIRRFQEGYYILSRFSLDVQAVIELERNLHASQDVLRHLIIKVDKKAPEPVARQVAVQPEPPAPPPVPPAAPAVTEETPVAEAPAATEETPVAEAPAATEETPAAEAPAATEETPVAEAPAATEETPVAEAPAATEETPVAEAPAATEETPVAEAPAATEETPVAEAPAATEEATDEAPAAEEEPAAEAPAATEEKPEAEKEEQEGAGS